MQTLSASFNLIKKNSRHYESKIAFIFVRKHFKKDWTNNHFLCNDLSNMRLRYACIPCAVMIFRMISPRIACRMYTFVCCKQTAQWQIYTQQRINCPIKYRKNIKIQAPIPTPQCIDYLPQTSRFVLHVSHANKHCYAALPLIPCHKL